jgi:hypothetical protein
VSTPSGGLAQGRARTGTAASTSPASANPARARSQPRVHYISNLSVGKKVAGRKAHAPAPGAALVCAGTLPR